MDVKKINFKDRKYVFPAILYPLVLFVGYFIIDAVHTDVSDNDPRLATTDYLNSDLPAANTDSVLGGKLDNAEREYGQINDLSGVENVENDRDSVNKKEDYSSQYSDREAEMVRRQQEQQQAQREEQRKIQEMHGGDDEYGPPIAGSHNGGNNPSYGNNGSSVSSETDNNAREAGERAEGVPEKVVKKVKTPSDYFNTISSSSTEESKLIKAIIDEDVKAQEGSRVRLRLLDDVEIGDMTVKKGTYLYAQMSGFGHQRVKGTVQSIFSKEEIIRVSLSIYDTDGQEGLYVPLSSFKETGKEILGSATQGGTNIVDNTASSTGVKGWASQAVQNASQQVMNAVGKVIRRNRVKLKYGTLVYLIDGSQQEKRQRK